MIRVFIFVINLVCVTWVPVKAKEIKVVNNTIACGSEQPQIVTEKTGFLTSPNFDGFHYYAPNTKCSWTLKAPKGQVFILKKMHFQLNYECQSDYLSLNEGEPPNTKLIGQYCGFFIPSRYQSESNVIHLKFTTGRFPRGTGFQFFFKQTLPTVYCKEDEITCRHQTKCVTMDKKCDGMDDCGDGTDEEKCDYDVSEPQCGVPKIPPALGNDRIVGGRDAIPGSWPWQVSLRIIPNEPFSHHCGGVLINRQWVLTAAHCFKRGMQNVEYWNVVVGKHFRLIPDDTEELRYMKSIIIHPEYKGMNDTRPSTPWLIRKQHDVALVQLNAPVTINDYVLPICLPSIKNYTIPDGTHCYVTGWGETYGTGFELELKQAMVPVVSREKCREWHSFLDIAETMVCAGYAQGGHDSCQGDSGGPLVYKTDQKWTLAGIVSTGGSICGYRAQPGIYSAVSFYTGWIEKIIK